MTVFAMAVTLVAFVTLRSVSEAWTRQVQETPNNRVVSRHKIGWSQSLPLNYAEEVRQMPGVRQAMGGRWAGLKHPTHTTGWFEATAVQAAPFVAMHYELVAPEAQKQAFLADRRGVLISQELAEEFGLKLGDTFHLLGTFLPGDWEFAVRSIYTSTRHGFAQRAIWFHYEYFNERLPPDEKDRIGIISAEVIDPSQGAEIARAIDLHFDGGDDQTYTQEDQALNASFVGMFGALLEAIDVVSVLILGIVAMLIGNTIAMGVRERTQEFGVLRAIGFRPKHIVGLVLGESALLGFAGASFGLLLAYPLVKGGVGRFLKETMELPAVELQASSALMALGLGVLLALLGALGPAYRTTQLSVVGSLRHVG
jgi:putative ABC transport system permease protein